VIPANTSALLSFSIVAKILALSINLPIGAEPGFQSVAMAKLAPASNSFRAGVKAQPIPNDAAGNATGITSEPASKLISFSVDASRWSADTAASSTANLEPEVLN